ncbi:MAG: cupin [Phreatobacter sp.]|jgi:quercetin dioxygenase-like cupin family protein|uniref:cupin n=1 Tax=Phreatobacter sp. TaxID=1966341 RepID=UPI004036B6D2
MTFTCRPPADPQLLIENDKIKVTRWNFSDGAETGWHTHGWDYVVVPLSDGKLIAELGDGTSGEYEMKTHEPYFRKEGVNHNIVNITGRDFAFIEIEIKPS